MKFVQTIKNLLAQTSGSKSYLAGLGLLGLAFYQFTSGDPIHGLQSAMLGLGTIGIRHAIEKQRDDSTAPPSPPTIVA